MAAKRKLAETENASLAEKRKPVNDNDNLSDLAQAVSRWQKKKQTENEMPEAQETWLSQTEDDFGDFLDDLTNIDSPAEKPAVEEPAVNSGEKKKKLKPGKQQAQSTEPKKVQQAKSTEPQQKLQKLTEPTLTQLPENTGPILLPTMSVVMCYGCHDDLRNRVVYEMTGGRQLVQFNLCKNCVELNGKMKRVYDYAFRPYRK